MANYCYEAVSDLEKYRELMDPTVFELSDKAEEGEFLIIGAATNLQPVGILVIDPNLEKEAEIIDLYVEPTYREEGIAKTLLMKAFDVLAFSGFRGLISCAYISDKEGDADAQTLEDFLLSQGMEDILESPDIVCINVDQLKKDPAYIPFFAIDYEMPEDVHYLDEMDPIQELAVREIHYPGAAAEYSFFLPDYAGNMLLLVRKCSENSYAMEIDAEGAEISKDAFLKLFGSLLSVLPYERDIKICIEIENAELDEFINSLNIKGTKRFAQRRAMMEFVSSETPSED